MTNFIPIAFIDGITLSQFINDIDRFNEPIVYDVICHTKNSSFAVTFGYYQHNIYDEGTYTSALYKKACKANIVSVFCHDNYSVNVDGKPAKNYIILVEYQQPSNTGSN